MTRIEALKKLAEKVTGVRPKGRTIAQLIDAIAENYSGGGGGVEKITFTISVEGGRPVVTSTHSPEQVNSMISLAKPCIAEILGVPDEIPALPIYKVKLVGIDGELVPTVLTIREYDDEDYEVIGYLYEKLIVADGSGWKLTM